jgi:hypothetical protein
MLAAWLWMKDPWTTMGRENRKVSLGDISSVDRIVLVDAYDSTELVRMDAKWLLFGEEECNQTAVENLLFAASRLQISSVLSSGAWEEAAAEAGPARKISWYKGRSELLSYVFYSASGKYMLSPPNSDKAYYVSVSGYPELDLDRVFSSASNHYREHLLIDLLPKEISDIRIQLPGESFRFLQDSAGNISLETPGENDQSREVESLDLAVRLLFSYFTSIRYEKKSGISADSLIASGKGSMPMATLQVASFSGEDHRLRVYPFFESPGEEAHLFKALVIYNQEPEALLINYIYLDVLMRGLSHYVGEK